MTGSDGHAPAAARACEEHRPSTLAFRRIHVIGMDLWELLLLLACSVTIWVTLSREGFEGPWYSLTSVMAFREDPPYRHRILFVLIATAIRSIFPGSKDVFYFLLSQALACLLVCFAIREWARSLVGKRLAFLGPLLLAAIVPPTFTYYTFYDVGIILFFTVCLHLLMQRRPVWYCLSLMIGTLNHESTLFMIPASIAMGVTSGWRRTRILAFVAAQLAGYAAVRLLLLYLMPVERLAKTPKFWRNLERMPGVLVVPALTWGLWYGLATVGFRNAPAELRRSVVLLPMLMAMALIIGNIEEARLFDAFVPILIGLLLCGLAVWTGKGQLRPGNVPEGE